MQFYNKAYRLAVLRGLREPEVSVRERAKDR
jgi:hypothetical protein